MKYYENSLVLQGLSPNRYQMHQLVSTFLRDTADYQGAYSLSLEPKSNATSELLLRTAEPIDLPGVRNIPHEISPQLGQFINFKVSLYMESRQQVGERSIHRPVTFEQMLENDRLADYLLKRGLRLRKAVKCGQSKFSMQKNGLQEASFLVHHLHIVASVSDPAAVERAVLEGLGKKRIFGFGQLRNIELGQQFFVATQTEELAA